MNLLEMRQGELLKDAMHFEGEILGGRDAVLEAREGVQIGVVEAIEEMGAGEGIEIGQIAEHSGERVELAAEGDLDRVVVAVTVRVVALAEDGAVALGIVGRGVQAMRGTEVIAAGEIDLH